MNIVDNDNSTPLLWACSVKNNVSNVLTLLDLGADVTLTTKNNLSALHVAARDAGREIIECLITHNASVNIFNNDKDTPLMVACSVKNNIDNVLKLLKHGADINLTNSRRASALHFAARNADSEIIECLINHEIPVNLNDGKRNTPLMWACFVENNIKNVQPLISHGADVHTKNRKKVSALHIAARYADSETVDCLINHSISVNIINDVGDTPLMWACIKKNNVKNV